ncbi:MAG: hypothetical protein ACYTF1_24005, partial [Planctomycetota bacterium]
MAKMETKDTNSVKRQFPAGSALILAVVLTSLLAIVGVMFVMVARVDRISTSAISENRELDSAVEAVVAKISQGLVMDVPGMPEGQEYYDYPDNENAWLASLEPHKDGVYKWRQISDVTGYIEQAIPGVKGSWDTQDIEINNNAIIEDHKEIELDNDGDLEEQLADADGDGVADSKWIELDGINSNKGRPIYAAIRVIDNGAMLNVNTAYKFDPTSNNSKEIDGSSQMQIDLEALARGTDTIDEIDDARNPYNKQPSEYQDDLIWRIEDPCRGYLPFDISDELELRNRYFLTTLGRTRLEMVWLSTIGRDEGFWKFKRVPYDGKGVYDEDHWWRAITQDSNQPDRRHFLTNYNMDRIIKPNGRKMLNINRINPIAEPNITDLYNAIRMSFADVGVTNGPLAAQIAVNLVDFQDEASGPNVVTTFDPLPPGGTTYYGFERPCVYISELAHKFTKAYTPPGLPYPGTFFNTSYAIELHKPYTEDDYPDANWQLVIEDYNTFPVRWSGSQSFHVMLFENPNAPLEPEVVFDLSDWDPNFPPSVEKTKQNLRPGTLVIASGRTISLQRYVGNDWVSVDSVYVPYPEIGGTWLKAEDGRVHSYQRDITRHKCIRRLWDDLFDYEDSETLGDRNSYTNPSTEMIQAHPEDKPFTNVGEIGMLFREDVYGRAWGNADTEADVRLNLADPNYRGLFKYLTVSSFDPSSDNIDNDGDGYTDEWSNPLVAGDEIKVPG